MKTQIRIFIIVDELLGGGSIDGFNKYQFEIKLNKDGMDLAKAKEIMNQLIDVANGVSKVDNGTQKDITQ